MPNLVLLGIQGSGKGTQADLLSKKYGFIHLNIGSLLREQMSKKTKLGKSVKEYMLRGDLVPDEYIFTIMAPILSDLTHCLVLDGFPRNLKQAKYLEKRIEVKYAIYFELSDEIAKERLNNRRICQHCQQNFNLLLNNKAETDKCSKCGSNLELRSDDNKKAINTRIEAFHSQTKPVIDFYQEKDSLIVINSLEKPQIIHEKLVNLMELPMVLPQKIKP